MNPNGIISLDSQQTALTTKIKYYRVNSKIYPGNFLMVAAYLIHQLS
jgi:hypothetical protein